MHRARCTRMWQRCRLAHIVACSFICRQYRVTTCCSVLPVGTLVPSEQCPYHWKNIQYLFLYRNVRRSLRPQIRFCFRASWLCGVSVNHCGFLVPCAAVVRPCEYECCWRPTCTSNFKHFDAYRIVLINFRM